MQTVQPSALHLNLRVQSPNMADGGDSNYTNSNRAFLQAFLARSTLTFEEAKPILAAISTAHGKAILQFSPDRVNCYTY